jgi:hypothetical protein
VQQFVRERNGTRHNQELPGIPMQIKGHQWQPKNAVYAFMILYCTMTSGRRKAVSSTQPVRLAGRGPVLISTPK